MKENGAMRLTVGQTTQLIFSTIATKFSKSVFYPGSDLYISTWEASSEAAQRIYDEEDGNGYIDEPLD